MIKIDKKTDALLIVDYQNDFITGSLAVKGAEDLLPTINKYITMFKKVFMSRDRHKKGHPSFVEQGGPWPIHCEDGTFGMDIHSGITYPDRVAVALVDKGFNEEAYSAFERTNLPLMLEVAGISRLFICGLATEYCDKATVMDALKKENFGGEVYLLTDAIAPVDVNPGDGDKALEEMENAGTKLVTMKDFE